MRIHRALVVLILTLAFTGTLYARHRSAPTVPVREVEGVVKSLSDTQLVVTDEHNHDVTMNVTADTVFRHGDMAIAPADIMTGDRVEVKAAQTDTALNALIVKVEQEEQQHPQVVEVSGAIKSVSATELVVTDAQQHDTTFTITPDTMIRKGDQAATAADLAVGDRVEVKGVQSGTALNALLVKVEENEEPRPQMLEVRGTIKSVSATEIVVTDAQQHDTTFTIDNNTIIRKGDMAATPADLAIGDRVEVVGSVSGTTNTALSIHAEAPETEPEDDAEVSGTVKTAGSSSITVTTRSGDVVVNTDANTRIRKDDRTIALSDIKTGDQVEAKGMRVDAHTILAKEIEVRSSSSGGRH